MAINWTNVTSVNEILETPNAVTGGWFWLGMLFMIFSIFLIVLLSRETKPEIAVLSSGFIGLIGAIFLSYMSLIAWTWTLFFVGLLLATFLYTIWSATNDNLY